MSFAARLYSSNKLPTALPDPAVTPVGWRMLVADVSNSERDPTAVNTATLPSTSESASPQPPSPRPNVLSHPLDHLYTSDLVISCDDSITDGDSTPTYAEATNGSFPQNGAFASSPSEQNTLSVPPKRWHEFDAVVVCNGHFSDPYVPRVDGDDVFPGILIHAHNYRTADRYRGKIVVVVG